MLTLVKVLEILTFVISYNFWANILFFLMNRSKVIFSKLKCPYKPTKPSLTMISEMHLHLFIHLLDVFIINEYIIRIQPVVYYVVINLPKKPGYYNTSTILNPWEQKELYLHDLK